MKELYSGNYRTLVKFKWTQQVERHLTFVAAETQYR